VSHRDIVANMSRGWNRDPAGVHSAPSAPACPAALWTHDQNDVQEVWTEPDRAQHIVCLQLSNFAAEMFLDGRLHYAMQHRSGTASLVRAGQRPRAILKGRWQIMHLYLPSNLFRDLHDGTSITGRPEAVELIDPKCTHDPAIHRIAQEVLSEMREGQPLSRLRTDALGLDLAIQLLRRWSNLAGTRALTRDPARGGLAPWQLRRVTDHMQSHLDRDVTLAELSALVGLSPYHFCRAFAASTGLPPHRWLVERRIERAKELMAADPRLGLTEVALGVGYAGQSAFGTAFRRVTGTPPSAWRRERIP
jgi:AraC family transcriptional regulator